ncbi:MAG TPA: hypothetical protein VES68_03685 [Candidatus Sulfotelmatobacter sp.]|nr:hypothetical protein [Candidatus Sulfotelmatobacter sp.]
MGLPERRLQNQEETFGIIRNHIQGVFRTNYDSFKEERVNPHHLIAIRYTGKKERDIFFYAGGKEIILPYGDLDDLFVDVFREDIDESLPPMRFKEFANLSIFPGMSSLLGRYIGERFWQERTLYKLKSDNSSERKMIIQTHFYDPVAKDTLSPRFDIWIGERDKTDRASDEEHDLAFKVLQTA